MVLFTQRVVQLFVGDKSLGHEKFTESHITVAPSWRSYPRLLRSGW